MITGKIRDDRPAAKDPARSLSQDQSSFCSRVDNFSIFLKGTGLYAQKRK